MRNMRKWMTGLLAAAMLLSLAACSGGEQATPETESSGQGEMDEVDFSRTEGIWRLDGEEGTASIYMDGEGGLHRLLRQRLCGGRGLSGICGRVRGRERPVRYV